MYNIYKVETRVLLVKFIYVNSHYYKILSGTMLKIEASGRAWN